MEILKVSSHSSPNSVAGAIAGVIREQRAVEVQGLGAGAQKKAIQTLLLVEEVGRRPGGVFFLSAGASYYSD